MALLQKFFKALAADRVYETGAKPGVQRLVHMGFRLYKCQDPGSRPYEFLVRFHPHVHGYIYTYKNCTYVCIYTYKNCTWAYCGTFYMGLLRDFLHGPTVGLFTWAYCNFALERSLIPNISCAICSKTGE
jgi:hypothetical protein